MNTFQASLYVCIVQVSYGSPRYSVQKGARRNILLLHPSFEQFCYTLSRELD